MTRISRSELMPPEIMKDAQKHACEAFMVDPENPQESIGVISKGKYVPIKNVSEDPNGSAKPDPEVFFNMQADNEIDCVIHSHPNGPFYPSGRDMQSQIDLAIPHGVLACYQGTACSPVSLWGDQLERLPLDGRAFQHGVTDCYEAIRDWYAIEGGGVELPPLARDWDWWSNDLNIYEDHFEPFGFYRISGSEVRRGDAIMFKMPTRSKKNKRLFVGETYNHAAVFLGNDTIYHHASAGEGYSATNISGKAALSRRLKHTPMYLRLKS